MTKAGSCPKAGEESNRGDGQQVDENSGENRVDEAKLEDRDSQRTNGEGGHNHIGR